MKNEKFEKIVNVYTVQTLTGQKVLRTKADFIDNLLLVENTTSLKEALKDFTEIDDNCKGDYLMLKHFIAIIDGIESQRFLEVIKPITDKNSKLDTDRIHLITELHNTKIDKIKDLANWLFA